jgi:AcrR family transcriptional regulator
MLGQAPVERADAARNRQRILAVASHMVASHGAEALSLDEVARAAGVGVGTVYRRFGDRAGLLYALIDERERQFQVAFMEGEPPLGPGAPPAQRLRAFLHAFLDRVEEQRELLVNLEMASSPPDRYVRGPHQIRHVHLTTLLAQARPGADARYLADALLAALSPGLVQHQREVRGLTVDQIKAGLDDLIACVLPGEADGPDRRRQPAVAGG